MRSVFQLIRRSMLACGVLLLLYAAGAVTYAGVFQRHAASDFEAERVKAAASAESAAHPRPLRRGDRVGQLELPRLGLSVIVLHGVETETLDVAAGHVPGTPLPGVEGNSAIAAHRDTFFRKLEGIRIGDVIRFGTPNQIHEFAVEWTEIVAPEDTRVLETHHAGSELTLITCYPFYFVGAAPDRFVVRARRISD